MTLLSGQISRNKIRQALEKLPDGLYDTYDTIMDRIGKQDANRKLIATTAFTWITYARERLKVEQLLHAILVNLDPEIGDIETDDLIDVDLVLCSCLGLVVLNKEDGIVRLVHYTTQDYLEKKFPKLDAHTSIAKASMTYINFVVDFSSTSKARNEFQASFRYSMMPKLDKKYNLAAYAANYLGVHLHEGNQKALAMDILNFLYSNGKRAVNPTYFTYFLEDIAIGFSELHFLAMFGLACVCQSYITNYMSPGSLSATR